MYPPEPRGISVLLNTGPRIDLGFFRAGGEEYAAEPGPFGRAAIRRADLLVYRSGPRWHNVSAGDSNGYLHEISGARFTAKDFRTWPATVLAAVSLASALLEPRAADAERLSRRHARGHRGQDRLQLA